MESSTLRTGEAFRFKNVAEFNRIFLTGESDIGARCTTKLTL